MGPARRMKPRASMLAFGASLIAATAVPSLRHKVAALTGIGRPGGGWKFLALALVFFNIKDVPFVWHVRLFRALLYHLYFQPTDLEKENLFLPVITQSYTPAMEIDYNLHKSNSTYFTDLDIARTHLVTAILRKGIKGVGSQPENEGKNVGWSFMNTNRAAGNRKRSKETEREEREREEAAAQAAVLEKASSLSINPLGTTARVDSGISTPADGTSTPVPGRSQSPRPTKSWGTSRLTEAEWWEEATKPGNLLIALGGNSCHYHREIPPYTRYEIWTRLLAWDRKWFYIVSHFVEADAFTPTKYVLQPWKKQRGGAASVVVDNSAAKTGMRGPYSEAEKQKLKKKIYASSISKYVVKKGRLTIPPELVLQRSEMLPVRPPGAPSTFFTSPAATPSESATPSSAQTLDVLEESLFAAASEVGGDEEWTWQKVESIRSEGMKLAGLFEGLDGLVDSFDDGRDGVMGKYADLVGNIYG